MSETTLLFRPVGQAEYQLVLDSGFRAFPPKLPEQSYFYPVTSLEYATQIARDWNTKDSASGFVGYVLQFAVRTEYLQNFTSGRRRDASRILDPCKRVAAIQPEYCWTDRSVATVSSQLMSHFDHANPTFGYLDRRTTRLSPRSPSLRFLRFDELIQR